LPNGASEALPRGMTTRRQQAADVGPAQLATLRGLSKRKQAIRCRQQQGASRMLYSTAGWQQQGAGATGPANKAMKLTKLVAAPWQGVKVPPRALQRFALVRTASQLIAGVRPTWGRGRPVTGREPRDHVRGCAA
jgi:hypothetical protein